MQLHVALLNKQSANPSSLHLQLQIFGHQETVIYFLCQFIFKKYFKVKLDIYYLIRTFKVLLKNFKWIQVWTLARQFLHIYNFSIDISKLLYCSSALWLQFSCYNVNPCTSLTSLTMLTFFSTRILFALSFVPSTLTGFHVPAKSKHSQNMILSSLFSTLVLMGSD